MVKVDRNSVVLAYSGQRSAVGGLRHNLSHNEPMVESGQFAICDNGHLSAKTSAIERSDETRREHRARVATRAEASQYHHVSRLDAAGGEPLDRRVLTFEYPRGALEPVADSVAYSCGLDDRALEPVLPPGRQVNPLTSFMVWWDSMLFSPGRVRAGG